VSSLGKFGQSFFRSWGWSPCLLNHLILISLAGGVSP
jgi:hypothetical protein